MSEPSQSGGDLHQAFNSPAPPSVPAAPAPENDRPASPPENPRAKGHSPARDQREAAPAPDPRERTIKLGGSEYLETDVRAALAERAEREVVKRSLPSNPDGYATTLPETFEAPVGMNFELNPDDPILRTARQLAHKHGLSQGVYSDFLGVFAANEITKARHVDAVRQANLQQLGSRAGARLDAISTFLGAHAGKDGAALADFVKHYPSIPFVRALERLAHAFSAQGDAGYSQAGRSHDAPKPVIPSMKDGASYSQARAAQDQLLGAQVRREGKRR